METIDSHDLGQNYIKCSIKNQYSRPDICWPLYKWLHNQFHTANSHSYSKTNYTFMQYKLTAFSGGWAGIWILTHYHFIRVRNTEARLCLQLVHVSLLGKYNMLIQMLWLFWLTYCHAANHHNNKCYCSDKHSSTLTFAADISCTTSLGNRTPVPIGHESDIEEQLNKLWRS